LKVKNNARLDIIPSRLGNQKMERDKNLLRGKNKFKKNLYYKNGKKAKKSTREEEEERIPQ